MRASPLCPRLLSPSVMGFASRQSAMMSLVPSLPSSQLKKPIDFLWQTNLQPNVAARCSNPFRTPRCSGFKQCSKQNTIHTSSPVGPPAAMRVFGAEAEGKFKLSWAQKPASSEDCQPQGAPVFKAVFWNLHLPHNLRYL